MAAKRRSLADGLNPREEAFLKGRDKQANKQESSFVELVTVTVRVPRTLTDALRLAAVKRKTARTPPMTQQDIVQDALARWLAEHE